MLVLRRKVGETIVINNVIKITVLSVEGDRVKIGIAAPPDVIVVREELLDRTESETNGMRGEYIPRSARTDNHVTQWTIAEKKTPPKS